MSTSVYRVAALLAVVGLSSSALAGGHGFAMRPGGGMRMGHAMPPVAGTWHVRSGRSFITGADHGGFAFGRPGGFGRVGGGYASGYGFGHTNTAFTRPAFIGRPGYGIGQQFSYGHSATAPNGFVRYSSWSRYGVHDRGRLMTRYGRYPHVPVYGYGYGYGGSYGSAAGGSVVPVPYPVGGYGEPALAAQYSEPALNQGSFGSYGTGEAYPSVVGTGGPQVIVVNNNYGGSGCNCRAARTSPVVYRYGVGTYY